MKGIFRGNCCRRSQELSQIEIIVKEGIFVYSILAEVEKVSSYYLYSWWKAVPKAITLSRSTTRSSVHVNNDVSTQSLNT